MRSPVATLLLVVLVTAPCLLLEGQQPFAGQATKRASPPAPDRADAGPATGAADEASAKRIRTLIQNLGSSLERIRDSAEEELRDFGYRAVPALLEAQESPKAERARRARRLLSELLKGLATVVDALGEPLGNCTVKLPLEGGEVLTVTASQVGHVALPEEPDKLRGQRGIIAHPEYGQGLAELEEADGVWRFQVALVRKGTATRERALEGVVVDPGDRPVSGVVIQCTQVRTPGEGLINSYGAWRALTDDKGSFSMYIPGSSRKKERGDLIPPNSRYHLVLDPPESAGLFPFAGRFHNTEPARIRLEKPERHFVLEFEDPDGGRMLDVERLARISMNIRRKGGEDMFYVGARLALAGGGKLLPGIYRAMYDGRDYAPIEIGPESPDKLVFRFPPPAVFAGRVVDGISGVPMSGAFVMAFSGISHNNLALLEDENWKRLHALPASPPLDDTAVKTLDKHYGVLALTRTDADGRYEIHQPPGEDFYALLAFQKNFLPYRNRTHKLEDGEDGRRKVPDLPLYPAAKILVRPVVEGQRLSVSPKWLLEKTGQPDWVKRFRHVLESADREVEYVHWLKNDELQPIFVPCGLRLRVRFETPYSDEWAPAEIDRVLDLGQGETLKIGDIRFPKSIPVQVLVLDSAGKPLEGAPVRRSYGKSRSWCVAHNTDAKGLAYFYVHPDSNGLFRVSDLPRDSGEAKAPNLTVPFAVKDQHPPDEPFRITLTEEQVKLLLGASAKR